MSRENPSPARLEAFSDGVIAVIITIMVLELKVPRQDGLPGLYVVLPTLLVYLLSFAFTGIYWINHHELVRRIKHVDGRALYANLCFLFCLSLIPFFTDYVGQKKLNPFSIAIYAADMVVTGFSFFMLQLAIARILQVSGNHTPEDASVQRKSVLSLLLYLAAIPLAYWRPMVAMADIAAVTLVWIVPSFGIKRSNEDPHPTSR